MSAKKTRLKAFPSWVPKQLGYLITPSTIDTEQSAIHQRVRDLGLNRTMPNFSDLPDASLRDGDGSDRRPGS